MDADETKMITEQVSELTSITYAEGTPWAENLAKLGLWLEYRQEVALAKARDSEHSQESA